MSNTINIEGVEYVIADLPATVQNLINIHAKWAADTEEARLVFAKNEAAVRELSREIIVTVQQTAAAKDAQNTTAPSGKKAKKA